MRLSQLAASRAGKHQPACYNVSTAGNSLSRGISSSHPITMDATKPIAASQLPAEVLATMAEIGEHINASLNLDEVLAHSAEQIKRLIDYEIFAVLLLDENTRELNFRFSIGHRKEVVETWRIPVGQGIIGTAAATGRTVRVSDVRKDSRYLNALDAVQSELAVPLS